MIAAFAGGMAGCALLAALAAALRPAAPGARAAGGWLLALSGALLCGWGAASLRPAPPSLSIVLPAPFPAYGLGLAGLTAGAALLGGLLFVASGLLRAAGVGAGGSGTGLLLHLLLLCVAWFLASTGALGMLAAWEGLSGASYFLLVRDRPRVRRAAWALLGLSEFGAMLLFFALLAVQAGLASAPGWAAAVAFLALFAFGAKAGLFPLQVWMPLAEPEAPGDVAGLFSGLLTAVAVVGFLRVVHLVTPPLLPLGVACGLFGLAGATGSALLGLIERDAKRVLAYGTLEALGLVFTALGAGMALSARGDSAAAEMAVAGALVLLGAHAGAKFALFALAGFVEERGGLRLLDRMGGILHRRPGLAGPLLLAVCTAAGLPPFGAFLGEWLLIEACFASPSGPSGLALPLAVIAALTALVSAAGLTLYLRWIGIGFLGPVRSEAAAALADVPGLGAVGLWLAGSIGAATGIGAGWILPWASAATSWLAQGQPLIAATYVHPAAFAPIVALGAALFAGIGGSTGNVVFAGGGFNVASPWDLAVFAPLLGLAVAAAAGRLGRRPVRMVRTWVGGEPASDLRLAWTAEGLNHVLRLTFAGVFGLRRSRVAQQGTLGLGFRYRVRVLLLLEHHIYRPLLAAAARLTGAVRERTQSGDLAHYVGYLLTAALLGLAVVAWRG